MSLYRKVLTRTTLPHSSHTKDFLTPKWKLTPLAKTFFKGKMTCAITIALEMNWMFEGHGTSVKSEKLSCWCSFRSWPFIVQCSTFDFPHSDTSVWWSDQKEIKRWILNPRRESWSQHEIKEPPVEDPWRDQRTSIINRNSSMRQTNHAWCVENYESRSSTGDKDIVSHCTGLLFTMAH